MSAWRESAACLDKPVEWFFPPKDRAHELYRLGREVCASCPVVADCLAEHEAAERELEVVLPGLWGGVIHGTAKRRPRPIRWMCVVCGTRFPDSGSGVRPQYCSAQCKQGLAV